MWTNLLGFLDRPEFWAFVGTFFTVLFSFLIKKLKVQKDIRHDIDEEQIDLRKELRSIIAEYKAENAILGKENKRLAAKVMILSAKMIYVEGILQSHGIKVDYPLRIKQLETELYKGEKLNGNNDG